MVVRRGREEFGGFGRSGLGSVDLFCFSWMWLFFLICAILLLLMGLGGFVIDTV